MSDTRLQFPPGFLWGSATSAYQVEGGIEYNDWVGAARSGTVPLAGAACDHYNRYEEDFDIAASLNQNAHRFSIEWSRIEIEKDRWDEAEIEHYRAVLEALKKRNITPFVTLHHFTNPVWFSRIGGWENRKAPDYFVRYVKRVVSELKDLVSFWVTINEPTVYAGESYALGTWPPHKRNVFTARRVLLNLVRAHKMAYEAIKEIPPVSFVGIAQHIVWFLPANAKSPLDIFLAKRMQALEEDFLKKIRSHQDFIGVNYYRPRRLAFSLRKPKDFFMRDEMRGDESDIGWEIWPEGMYYALKSMRKYNLPIYIMENGIADEMDTKRETYIRDHLIQVHRAIKQGIPVKGYFHWSLLDNFEWAYGYSKKFGLVRVNFLTQERTIRKSAYSYAEICKNNAI